MDDALYLRKNLVDGGVHIISKYSGKSPLPHPDASTLPSSPKSRFRTKGRRGRVQKHTRLGKSSPPRVSPTKYLQDQGGIEGIIQEAARGVYNRSEKWGVARALRSAVQGLQAGPASPRRLPDGSRWSLDDGKFNDGNSISHNSSNLVLKIRALEQRNTALAKMLENATEELWIQQKRFSKDQADTTADALSLAIAKVQFVQVYLENSTMPFPMEDSVDKTAHAAESTPPVEAAVTHIANTIGNSSVGTPESSPPSEPITVPAETDSATEAQFPTPSSPTPPAATRSTIATDAALPAPVAPNHPGPSSFHQPRPSLAQSSFSWMLGEDQRRSSFVSASPFPSAARSARGKVGFLFGDDKVDGKKSSTPPHGKETTDEEPESITLGTLTLEAGGR